LSNFSLSNSALRHSLLKSVIRDSFRIDSVQINYTEKESLFLYPILIYFKELFILTHKIIRSRILEDDLVTVKGVSAGIISYKATSGTKISIPGLAATEITDSGTAPDDYGE
ncbi:hypothetical protein ACYSJL_10170, partial [Lactobacillus delbrueckii]